MVLRSGSFDRYAFSKHPNYDEAAVRKQFAKAVRLRTVCIYCYDPRAIGIPEAVARQLGDVFPGQIVRDEDGKKVASTASLFEVVVAGGRAIDALRSITVAQHLFGIENIAVVHHTYCGATSFTPRGIVDAFKAEHGVDIDGVYPRQSIAIADYVSSLEHDTRLIREAKGTPPHVKIYGFLYDIDTETLMKVVDGAATPRPGARSLAD